MRGCASRPISAAFLLAARRVARPPRVGTEGSLEKVMPAPRHLRYAVRRAGAESGGPATSYREEASVSDSAYSPGRDFVLDGQLKPGLVLSDFAGPFVLQPLNQDNDGVLDALSYDSGDLDRVFTMVNAHTDGLGYFMGDSVTDDTLTGGDVGDYIVDGSGDDHLNGGGGDDYLEGGAGADTYDGGSGYNILSYAGAGRGIIVSDFIPYSNGDAYGDSFTNIQAFIGSAYDDNFNFELTYTVEGGGGADEIIGLGEGLTASYEHSTAGVQVNLSGASANTGGDAEGDSLSGVSNLTGSALDDRLLGDGSANTLLGRGGADALSGRAGNDAISGGADADRLRGNAGDDVLTGGDGRDHLRGGGGADTFVFAGPEDSAVGGRDVILDFSGHGGQGDRIDLSAIGDLTFVDRFSADGTGEIRAIAGAGGVQIVLVDADGSGKADFSIRVDSTATLTAADFLLSGPTSTAASLDAFGSHHAFAEPFQPVGTDVLA